MAYSKTPATRHFPLAVALLNEGHRPDLVFIDHNLGEGLGGIDLAREARRVQPDIEVLYTTADMLTDGTRAMFVELGEFLPPTDGTILQSGDQSTPAWRTTRR